MPRGRPKKNPDIVNVDTKKIEKIDKIIDVEKVVEKIEIEKPVKPTKEKKEKKIKEVKTEVKTEVKKEDKKEVNKSTASKNPKKNTNTSKYDPSLKNLFAERDIPESFKYYFLKLYEKDKKLWIKGKENSKELCNGENEGVVFDEDTMVSFDELFNGMKNSSTDVYNKNSIEWYYWVSNNLQRDENSLWEVVYSLDGENNRKYDKEEMIVVRVG